MGRLKIKDYPKEEVVEIEGIRYHHNFFLDFSKGLKRGDAFRFVKREDGVVTLSRLKNHKLGG